MNALYIVCGLGFLSLVAEITNLKRGLIWVIALGLAGSVVWLSDAWGMNLAYFHDMLVFDNFAIAFTSLIIVVSIFWFWMAKDYFIGQSHETDRSALVLFALTGAIIMTSFGNMAMLFLGIEILSISLYVLAGSNKESLYSNEAAFKYFLMGSFATGFLLMGIALVYGATGSFHISKIHEFVALNSADLPGFFYAGVIMMMIGLAFKISAVPFHFWAPDVYDGSPVTITAFMATIVKVAAVAAFWRIFASTFAGIGETWTTTLQVIMILTLVIPNVTAVFQSNVKRMLAYSSVGNVGYILLAFVANGAQSAGTIFYYLASYALTTIAAFTILYEVEKARQPNGFEGLYRQSPILATCMTVCMLSLAGIPPLAGFFAKYMVFSLALSNGYTGSVIIAVVTSLVGVFYYFRVIIAMYKSLPGNANTIHPTTGSVILVTLLSIFILALGLFPDGLISLLAH
ncbi:MAG TPA: NADH-quinone oxidoreductase subunit N [Cyclobacteriaceae bacterium]|nr:NADH-quinone oxidoreductase subunit N [Cyclobacteriaceae bacterium]